MAPVLSLHNKKKGENGEQWQILFSSIPKSVDGDFSHKIKRHMPLIRKVLTNLDSILKSRDIALPTNVCIVKAMVFPSSHVWMWEFDYKESTEELMLLNCGVGEDSWESFGLQGGETSHS